MQIVTQGENEEWNTLVTTEKFLNVYKHMLPETCIMSETPRKISDVEKQTWEIVRVVTFVDICLHSMKQCFIINMNII